MVQLKKEHNTQFDIVVETKEAESYQNPPAVGMQLGDYKLVEIEDFYEERVYGKSKTRLRLLFINYDCILRKNLVIHTNVRIRSMNLEDFLRDMVVIVQTIHVLFC